jgi:hypothetical protein
MQTSRTAEGVVQRTSRAGDLNPLISHSGKFRENSLKDWLKDFTNNGNSILTGIVPYLSKFEPKLRLKHHQDLPFHAIEKLCVEEAGHTVGVFSCFLGRGGTVAYTSLFRGVSGEA